MYRVTYFTLNGKLIGQKTISRGTRSAVFKALPKGTGNILVYKVTEFDTVLTYAEYTFDLYTNKWRGGKEF